MEVGVVAREDGSLGVGVDGAAFELGAARGKLAQSRSVVLGPLLVERFEATCLGLASGGKLHKSVGCPVVVWVA